MEEMVLKEEIVEESESMPHQPEEILSLKEHIVKMDVRHHSRESATEEVKIVETEVSRKPEPSFELIQIKEIPKTTLSKQEMHIESVETSPEAVMIPSIESSLKSQEIMPDKKKKTEDMPLQKRDDTPRKEMVIKREIEVHKKESIHLQQSVHENNRSHEETPQISSEITPLVKPKEKVPELKEVRKVLQRGKLYNLQQMPQLVYCNLYLNCLPSGICRKGNCGFLFCVLVMCLHFFC